MANVSIRQLDATISNKDVEIEIKDNSGKLGILLISRGNIEWVPSGNYVNKKRLSWKRFAQLMLDNGRDVQIVSPVKKKVKPTRKVAKTKKA